MQGTRQQTIWVEAREEITQTIGNRVLNKTAQ